MIQKTYAQITREIQALQAHAEKLRAAELQTIVTKLNETIAKHGLKAEDLRFASAGSASGTPVRASRQAASSASRSATSAAGAKYGDGHGNSWGGRGPRPAWLRDVLSKGRTLESFALSGNEASDPAPTALVSASSKAEAKAQSSAAKSPLPPLYSHPKTGQTWSGRGPKPAWLKQGLKKRGASLNDFLISARQASSDVPDTAQPAASASPASTQTPRTAKSSPAPQNNGSKKKSSAEKISSHVKPSSAASTTPVPATKPAASKKAPAKKTSEAGNATTLAKKKSKPVAKESATSSAPKSVDIPQPPTPVTLAATAKRAASKSIAKTAAKNPKKPSAKTGPASKRSALSMAPPADTPPKSPYVDALQPTPVSGPADDQEPTAGI